MSNVFSSLQFFLFSSPDGIFKDLFFSLDLFLLLNCIYVDNNCMLFPIILSFNSHHSFLHQLLPITISLHQLLSSNCNLTPLTHSFHCVSSWCHLIVFVSSIWFHILIVLSCVLHVCLSLVNLVSLMSPESHVKSSAICSLRSFFCKSFSVQVIHTYIICCLNTRKSNDDHVLIQIAQQYSIFKFATTSFYTLLNEFICC